MRDEILIFEIQKDRLKFITVYDRALPGLVTRVYDTVLKKLIDCQIRT